MNSSRTIDFCFAAKRLPFDSSSRHLYNREAPFQSHARSSERDIYNKRSLRCAARGMQQFLLGQKFGEPDGSGPTCARGAPLGSSCQGTKRDVLVAWDAYDSHRIGADVRFSKNSDQVKQVASFSFCQPRQETEEGLTFR